MVFRAAAVWTFRGDESRRRRGHDVGYSAETSRGDAAAATWTFRGNKSRRRRGHDVGYSAGTSRGDAAATSWMVDESRRRRGRDVDSPQRRVAAAASWMVDESRQRRGHDVGYSAGTSRGDAAAASWMVDESRRRRGRDVDSRQRRVAAAASWMVDESRRRRGRELDSPRTRRGGTARAERRRPSSTASEGSRIVLKDVASAPRRRDGAAETRPTGVERPLGARAVVRERVLVDLLGRAAVLVGLRQAVDDPHVALGRLVRVVDDMFLLFGVAPHVRLFKRAGLDHPRAPGVHGADGGQGLARPHEPGEVRLRQRRAVRPRVVGPVPRVQHVDAIVVVALLAGLARLGGAGVVRRHLG